MKEAEKSLIISGTSHRYFAEQLAETAKIPLGKVRIERFPDGEIFAQILENVRGRTVFVVQSIAYNPNEYLMELLILVDALKRASCEKIVAVIPYYGYARQDRKNQARVPITAKLVANLLTIAGVQRVLTMDLHAGQVQGFFDIPVDNLHAFVPFMEAIAGTVSENSVVVAPDLGSAHLAKTLAHKLNAGMATIDKRRIDANNVALSPLMGNVDGKDVILIDDICSTATTLVKAAKLCKDQGARRVFAVISHALFVGDALEKLRHSQIDKMFITNSIPRKEQLPSLFCEISLAPLFARAMQCILSAESISSLFC